MTLNPLNPPRGNRPMTVSLDGELGIHDMADVVEMLARLVSNGTHAIVIDFTNVSHTDFRGLRPLIRWSAAFREAGGQVALAGLSPYIHAIFRSVGAHDAFDYFATADDAVRFVSGATDLSEEPTDTDIAIPSLEG